MLDKNIEMGWMPESIKLALFKVRQTLLGAV